MLTYEERLFEWERKKALGETDFILTEYQRIKHTFRKIDPRMIDNLCDENADQCANYLLQAYM